MIFKKSNKCRVNVFKEQEKEISSIERINSFCGSDGFFAFDIYDENILVGFIIINKFEENSYFLWNYLIDKNYQNKGYGTKSLTEFILYIKENFDANILTTTYNFGNNHAKHVYEKIGFVETDVVDENDIHEVNMVYKFKK